MDQDSAYAALMDAPRINDDPKFIEAWDKFAGRPTRPRWHAKLGLGTMHDGAGLWFVRRDYPFTRIYVELGGRRFGLTLYLERRP